MDSKKGVTHKTSIPAFSIERLRTVTDKRNTFTVDLNMPTYYCGSEGTWPGAIKEPFKKIIENFALCFRQKRMYLSISRNERYICSFIREDFTDCMIDPELYDKYFKIVRPSKLAFKMYWDDVLYIYDDDHMLVVSDNQARYKLRKIRIKDD